MTASVALPFGGLSGWAFLQRTRTAQQAVLAADPVTRRDEAYFRARIGSVKTAEDLVSDRRLLKVALEAFGLGADLNSRYFIRKVLADGTEDKTDLANRLADKQYLALSRAFGFGTADGPRTGEAGFADTILNAWRNKTFQAAVGDRSNALRLALNAEESLPAIATADVSDNTKWYRILGSAPLREVFVTAFGLPRAFSSQGLDQQLATMKQRSDQVFGGDSVGQFADPDRLSALLRRYIVLAGDDVAALSTGSRTTALQLLQPGSADTSSAGALFSLLLSR